KELRRSVNSLHNINLQRLDRMTMAHSIEGRVPFLDLKMIELAQNIPNSLKLCGNPSIEKWILRKTFENILPEEITWREKQQFDQGSGTSDLISKNIEQLMPSNKAEEYKQDHPLILLRTNEECFYHKIFSEKFPNSKQLLNTVGRWSVRPTPLIKKQY
ncbi:MAG: asparagine synthase-related protein, partial [Nitrosopumilaceae archaeon]